jgi:fucokinase
LNRLAEITERAWRAYMGGIAGESGPPWWTAVIITAGSERQAQQYRGEIERRREQHKAPGGALYLVVPDLGDRRIGSGGATLNALRVLAEAARPELEDQALEAWWASQRVLMIHAGGESRRLPQYSLSGRLFTALPVRTPWGEVSTVFDEILAHSTSWLAEMPGGLVVTPGDVVLTFDPARLDWGRSGVTGLAMRQPVEMGGRHGVYITDEEGRVYSFLQNPSAAQVRAAGGLLPGDQVALDTGLLRFDPVVAARLTRLAVSLGQTLVSMPVIDLCQHFVLGLTGQRKPDSQTPPLHQRLWKVLEAAPLWCCLVEGEFTHVGSTLAFRRLITEESRFTGLYAAQQRLGTVSPPGLISSGVLIDSVLAGGGELGPGALVIECHLDQPVRAGRGAILHGLTGIPGPVEAPEDTVLHQVPVALADGRRGVVIRVYGAGDDPRLGVSSGLATWLGRPILEALSALGLDPEAVWPHVALADRSLWNARLFPLGSVEEAWKCAQGMMELEGFALQKWLAANRLSLEASGQSADSEALAAARARRVHAQWQLSAVSLASGGADIRPLLVHAPGIRPLAAAGRTLSAQADSLVAGAPTEAASRHFQASLFLAQAGLVEESSRAREAAFACVARAVDQGLYGEELGGEAGTWRHAAVTVTAPPRIDLGGGWSDTPPFCLDWGGTVLNIAVALGGQYPIRATVRRLGEPLLRCVSEDGGHAAEYRSREEVLAPLEPGDPLAIARAALQMLGPFKLDEPLPTTLERCGGGLEISTGVSLPMGSGLGASSILAATVVRALAEMRGLEISERALSDQVMRLEQRMTTGGGWQDQAGGIFPGAKLVASGPGLSQRLRVQPVDWTPEREAEFLERLLLYYTGFRRMAKDLLRQVVGRYLARETGAVEVLHSIKTLAAEMAWAMREGEWDHLGRLIDRHWRLNQVLDPHTTNAPINALLEECRPWLAGAKLAGAGGGGFLLLLARDPEAAAQLRARLSGPPGGRRGALYEYEIANQGLHVEIQK